MDNIWEFNRILDEEHRDIVPNEVPVALLRVKLGRETSDVPYCILYFDQNMPRRSTDKTHCTSSRTLHSTDSGKHRRRP